MKFLITLMAVSLLIACTPEPSTVVLTGTKCMITTPVDGECAAGDAVGLIKLDANGVPKSVSTIDSCEDKKVTWRYEKPYIGKDDDKAPPFMVIFDPAIYPGKGNNYKVLSKPTPNPVNPTNQEFTINTRALKEYEKGECLNYDIMIPGKGLLDPVFIIRK
jgi:hypothetical protein